METKIDEIAAGIYRLSTTVDGITPDGFTFNQFIVDADEPLLFHTGHRQMFPLVFEAATKVVAPERLRWITFGHVEADECGSMNQWLEAAPNAVIAHGGLGVSVSIADMADRPPRALGNGEVLDLGGKRVRHIDTPHVPHGWEARVLYEETTGTLLCGDLFTQSGTGPAVTESEIVSSSVETEAMFRYTASTAGFVETVRRLADDLEPRTLACMHGSSFTGDGGRALRDLAAAYEERF